jgi:hypothetical protein
MKGTEKPLMLRQLPHGKEACDAVQIDWVERLTKRCAKRAQKLVQSTIEFPQTPSHDRR